MVVEPLVINRLGDTVHQRIVKDFPRANVISVDSSLTIPQMRAIGFREARADAIAVIEDHIIAPMGWADAMVCALHAGPEVVGGAVQNAATDTLLDWAAFLCEYSHCIPPLEAGNVSWLTGNNVVYRRRLIDRHRDAIEAGRWEDYLHQQIRDAGTSLICHPEIVVDHKKHYTFGEYMSQRYLYARSYAGARVQHASVFKRAAFGVAAFALPPLLLCRTVRRILAKGRHQAFLIKSLPLIALFVISWGAGEVIGYWFGPGDALSRVR